MIGGDGLKMEERVVMTILNTISESSDDDDDQVSGNPRICFDLHVL